METGTLELQIFISLIVILATAFIALVCDYLKGNNESLREYNIELRIRKQEQERHSPVEAVEWLQALLGANQRNPVRLATAGAGSVPLRAQAPRASAKSAEPASAPKRHQSDDVARIAARLGVTHVDEADQTDAEVEESTVAAVWPEKAKKQNVGNSGGPTLLQTLAMPEWVIREKDEKAAARRMRDKQVAMMKAPAARQDEEQVIVQPAVAEMSHAAGSAITVEGYTSTSSYSAENKKENYWTYRGLLDRVVAATSGTKKPEVEVNESIARPEPPPATEPVVSPEEVIAPAATMEAPLEYADTTDSSSATYFDHIATVAIDFPSGPLGTGSHPEMIPAIGAKESRASAEESIEAEAIASEAPEFVDTVARAIPQRIVMAEEAPSPPGSAVPKLQLPTGFHDRSVLPGLMASTGVMDGVIVAIGINDYAHHKEKMGAGPMADLMRSVENMVCGLLRKDIDFGCRSNEDEFVLVFPGETGVEAQRRLTTISERLWNFQLRSLTNFSVFFSWGAVEVSGETLPDAAASASERMYQTKRNRKTVTLDSQRRKLAV